MVLDDFARGGGISVVIKSLAGGANTDTVTEVGEIFGPDLEGGGSEAGAGVGGLSDVAVEHRSDGRTLVDTFSGRVARALMFDNSFFMGAEVDDAEG